MTVLVATLAFAGLVVAAPATAQSLRDAGDGLAARQIDSDMLRTSNDPSSRRAPRSRTRVSTPAAAVRRRPERRLDELRRPADGQHGLRRGRQHRLDPGAATPCAMRTSVSRRARRSDSVISRPWHAARSPSSPMLWVSTPRLWC
ncbi:MAG: hypothetical protein R2862_12760 [Thermoanaerobaculia bacterium]